MASKTLHAIATKEGEYGISMMSPQLPGFVAIYDDEKTMRRHYKSDIQQAGFTEGRVVGHTQVRGTASDGLEYVVRWSNEGSAEDRTEAGRRTVALIEAVDDPQRHELMAEVELNRAGELVIVCCLSGDTLGWVADQMDPRDDVVLLAASVADQMVFATQLAVGGGREWPSLESEGLSLGTTIAELMGMGARRPDRVAIGA